MAQTSIAFNQLGEYALKPNVNIEVSDEFNVGCAIESDLKSVQTIRPQFVYKPSCMMAWMRADTGSKMAMIGATKKLFNGNFKMTGELATTWGESKGNGGMPVIFRGGVEAELGEDTEIKSTFSFSEGYTLQAEVEHKYNKNWTLNAIQSFDSAKLSQKNGGPYHVGFGASYKL